MNMPGTVGVCRTQCLRLILRNFIGYRKKIGIEVSGVSRNLSSAPISVDTRVGPGAPACLNTV